VSITELKEASFKNREFASLRFAVLVWSLLFCFFAPNSLT
jgi:hypothetical protein